MWSRTSAILAALFRAGCRSSGSPAWPPLVFRRRCTMPTLPCAGHGRRFSKPPRLSAPADARQIPSYKPDVSASIALPDAPSVVAGHGRAAILTPDGEVLVLATAEAAALLRTLPPPILVHAPATFRRLG